MDREIELNAFMEKADDLINSSYILADVKIVNLLKAIANSSTICALIKSCLNEFNYKKAKEKYFVSNQYLAEGKKSFKLPENSKDIIALIFLCLMDIDNNEITLPEFLDTFFYDDGSSSSSYTLFANQMIRPFSVTVKKLTEDIITGKVQDPDEVVKNIEEARKQAIEQKEKEKEKQAELSKKRNGKNVQEVLKILSDNKEKFLNSKLDDAEKAERSLVIDELVSAIDSLNQDRITYSFLCYVYMAKTHKRRSPFKVRKIRKLLSEVIYEL